MYKWTDLKTDERTEMKMDKFNLNKRGLIKLNLYQNKTFSYKDFLKISKDVASRSSQV